MAVPATQKATGAPGRLLTEPAPAVPTPASSRIFRQNGINLPIQIRMAPKSTKTAAVTTTEVVRENFPLPPKDELTKGRTGAVKNPRYITQKNEIDTASRSMGRRCIRELAKIVEICLLKFAGTKPV